MSLTSIYVNLESITLFSYIISSNFSITGIMCWFFMITLSCCFTFLGALFYRIVNRRNLKIEYLAKYSIIYGLIILIGAFIQMEYLYLLQNQVVIIGTSSYSFESMLLNLSITPFHVVILWNILMYTFCGFTIGGTVITAGGLNKSLKIEKAQEIENQ